MRGRYIALLIPLILIIPAGSWTGYVSFLTQQNNRACLRAPGLETEDSIDGTGGTRPAPPSAETARALQSALDEFSTGTREVGLQATVIFPDSTVWNGTAGYADIKRECPMTLGHHLYIGSMTKLYTAALVLEHIEAGALSLDDRVSRWTDLPYGDEVSVRMLLNHTSGIPSYTEDTGFLLRYFALPRKRWRPAELTAVLEGKPLLFSPGTRHEYSNSNYLLLGVILESVTGSSYSALLSDLMEEKLNLFRTHYLDYPDDIPLANGYDMSIFHLGRRNLSGFRTSLETGAFSAGGIVSTSADTARFVHSLFTEKILGDAGLSRMLSFIDTSDPDVPAQSGYGLGVRRLEVGGSTWIGHTGTIPGYSGIAVHNRELSLTVVVLSNLSTIDQTGILETIFEAIR
ncbi:MAG: serine hydrolase domain-containing protein [Spirochaetia bacterium]